MRNRMMFFDCNCYIGQPSGGGPAASAEELTAAMDRAGIAQALVWHVAQRDLDPLTGNDLLGRGIAGRQRLVGCWTILPPQTGELGEMDGLLAAAGSAGVKAFRAFPKEGRFLLRGESLGGLLKRMIAARVPLILSMHTSVEWRNVYDLLSEVRLLALEVPFRVLLRPGLVDDAIDEGVPLELLQTILQLLVRRTLGLQVGVRLLEAITHLLEVPFRAGVRIRLGHRSL